MVTSACLPAMHQHKLCIPLTLPSNRPHQTIFMWIDINALFIFHDTTPLLLSAFKFFGADNRSSSSNSSLMSLFLLFLCYLDGIFFLKFFKVM